MTDSNTLRRLNWLWKNRHSGHDDIETRLTRIETHQDETSAAGPGISDHGDLEGLRDDDHWRYLTQSRHDRLGHRVYYDEFVDSNRVTLATASIQTATNPTKDTNNPLFPPSTETPTGEWDEERVYNSVIRLEETAGTNDGYLWHMFYTGFDGTTVQTGYARSADGTNWAKPNLGLVSYGGTTSNNILRTGYCNHAIYDEYSGLFVQVREELSLGGDIFLYTQETPTEAPTLVKTITTGTGDGEGKSICRRPTDGRWLLYYIAKHASEDRSVYLIISDTPELDGSWTEYGIILDAPDQDNQYYTLYPTVIGDQILYTVTRYDKTNEQTTTDLFVSRNGVDLTSVKADFITLGGGGSWDDEQVYASHIVTEDDSWHIYYGGVAVNHAAAGPWDARIGRATVNRERIGSVGTTGTITTDYVHVGPGAVLTVNADASSGTLEIEVQDVNGDAIPNYAQADFDDISTDSYDHHATWGQETLPGGTLRFVLTLTTNVTVYSLELTNSVPADAVTLASSALGDLSDVTITSVAQYDRLHYDGSGWVNTTQIWKPLLDDDGAIVTDGNGDPTMGLAPA